MHFRSVFIVTAILLTTASPGVQQAIAKRISTSAFIDQWDTDHDGTLDIDEFSNAAMARFDSLDHGHTGNLKRSQLRGIISYVEFRRFDTNKNGLLDKHEYRVMLKKLFSTADKDHNGTLDKKELHRFVGISRFRFFEIE
jgi:EF hand